VRPCWETFKQRPGILIGDLNAQPDSTELGPCGGRGSLKLLASGAVWPPEITRYKLADAAEAHRVSEGRHLRGKLVLEVR